MKKGHVPLERALSKLGLASRAQARQLIVEGQVRVHGRVARDPLMPVVPETARIQIGELAVKKASPLTILLHKPRGFVTTRSDEKGRATVYSLLSGVEQHLIPVGRLDLATTGLLLLTNDTRFSAWVTDPRNEIPRTYIVTVRGDLSDETAKRLALGVQDAGEILKATEIEIRKRSRRETHLTLTLAEGKNREIRRMLKSVGHEVTRLKRVAFGGLRLGDLPVGKWRAVSSDELTRAFPGAPRYS